MAKPATTLLATAIHAQIATESHLSSEPNAMICMKLQADTGEVLAGLVERVTYHNAEMALLERI